jgi:probable F420-dependent oxidoreductase
MMILASVTSREAIMELGRYGVFGHASGLTAERVRALESLGYEALADYLDVLDAEGVPAGRRVLAALGPRVLRLAAARTAGAHPYLVTPEHTRIARDILGPGKILAPEQRVVLEADPARARAVGRPSVVKPYLSLTNYTTNLQRLGFSAEDVAGEGSDQLIDALVVSGDDAEIRRRFELHHAAGADHVAVQLIAGPDTDVDAGFRRLAGILRLS